MAKSKVTSAKLAKLASKTLKGYEPTRDEIEALAASVMSQREKELATKKEEVVAPVPVADILPVVEEAAPAVEAPVEAPAVEVLELTPEEAEKRGFWSSLFKR